MKMEQSKEKVCKSESVQESEIHMVKVPGWNNSQEAWHLESSERWIKRGVSIEYKVIHIIISTCDTKWVSINKVKDHLPLVSDADTEFPEETIDHKQKIKNQMMSHLPNTWTE